MSSLSKIEWTDATWNPVTGCKKVSPGCKNCYAEFFAERFRGVKGHPFENGFDVTLWPKKLEIPLNWKSPKVIFVNSMSDLFLDQIPDSFIEQIFKVMETANHHIYQVLTKRPKRMLEWTTKRYSSSKDKKNKLPKFPANVWLGVSVETELYKNRIAILKESPAEIKFISFEPLLGEIQFLKKELLGVQWAIVGGESGHYARPMNPDWIKRIHKACLNSDVAFFFKQWGAYNEEGVKMSKKKAGRIYLGKTWDEMPKQFEPSELILS
jgi:protein gp37